MVGWLVGWFYSMSTLAGLLNAEIDIFTWIFETRLDVQYFVYGFSDCCPQFYYC